MKNGMLLPDLSPTGTSRKRRTGKQLGVEIPRSDSSDPDITSSDSSSDDNDSQDNYNAEPDSPECRQPSCAENAPTSPIMGPKDLMEESVSATVESPTASNSAPDPQPIEPQCFDTFRLMYLVVYFTIMLADGLQGTHLYVLYSGYGYSVASLYFLGFVSGAVTSPILGPIVDRVGRKKSAMIYCAIEILINALEQNPNFTGLIVSRLLGGITTNLLFTVFESWLVTEYRKRGFEEDKLEIILRDSVIASNLAAVASGYVAHSLAERLGPVGPFEGAVAFTTAALFVVMLVWNENYGCEGADADQSEDGKVETKSILWIMRNAIRTMRADPKICVLGIVQGFSEGCLQTFVFLWSPALTHFAASARPGALGLDETGAPAYGLIFGAFMACGVFGGLSEPILRRGLGSIMHMPQCSSSGDQDKDSSKRSHVPEVLASLVYITCACLLFIPFVIPDDWEYSFTVSLGAFLVYEFLVGCYTTCEGLLRSAYFPTSSMCSLMTMFRIIVNLAVAFGVISTNYIPFSTAFVFLSVLLTASSVLQMTLVPKEQRKLASSSSP